MLEYWIATDGTGTGVGSEADPYTWDQAAQLAQANDTIYYIKTGTYSGLLQKFVFTVSRIWLVGVGERPHLIFDPSVSGDAMYLNTNTRDNVIRNLEISGSGLTNAIQNNVAFDTQAIQVKTNVIVDSHPARPLSSTLCDYPDDSDIGQGNCESTLIRGDRAGLGTLLNSIALGQSTIGGYGAIFLASGSIIRANQTTGYALLINQGNHVDSCIFLDASVAAIRQQSSTIPYEVVVRNCLFFNCTLEIDPGIAHITEINNQSFATSPFEDAPNLDFRITTAAQSQSYINLLVRIMLGQLDTPGITMNTEAELLAMVGSGGGGGGGGSYVGDIYV